MRDRRCQRRVHRRHDRRDRTIRDACRLLNQANGGVSVARNRGVEISTGNCCAFWTPTTCWTPASSTCRRTRFGPTRNWICATATSSNFWSPELPARGAAARFRYAEPLWRKPLPGHISTWLFRRDLWDRVGGFAAQLRYAEDVDWFSRASRSSHAALTLPDVLTHRRLHPGNVTARRYGEQGTAIAGMLKAHLGAARGEAHGLIEAEPSHPAVEPPLADTLRLMRPCHHGPVAAGGPASRRRRRQRLVTVRETVPDPRRSSPPTASGSSGTLPLLYRNLAVRSGWTSAAISNLTSACPPPVRNCAARGSRRFLAGGSWRLIEAASNLS